MELVPNLQHSCLNQAAVEHLAAEATGCRAVPANDALAVSLGVHMPQSVHPMSLRSLGVAFVALHLLDAFAIGQDEQNPGSQITQVASLADFFR